MVSFRIPMLILLKAGIMMNAKRQAMMSCFVVCVPITAKLKLVYMMEKSSMKKTRKVIVILTP